MKTRDTIILISTIALVVSYVTITAHVAGPEDILNPASFVYFPGVVIQLVSNEGNGIICVDACGPCSAWGSGYVLVDGKCKIPDRVEDCYYISPPMEWRFVDGRCVPVDYTEPT